MMESRDFKAVNEPPAFDIEDRVTLKTPVEEEETKAELNTADDNGDKKVDDAQVETP